MKAVLVIDMPRYCDECDFCGYAIVGEDNDEYKYRSCCLSQTYLGEIAEDSKDSLCPLKPLPKELVYEGYNSPNERISEAILQSEWGKKAKKNDAICIRSFSIGYNACLEELVK